MNMLRLQLLVCCLLLAACGGGPDKAGSAESSGETPAAVSEQAAVAAVFKRNANIAACLAEENPEAEAAISACPTYVLQSLDYMLSECRAVGGTLQAMTEAGFWSLDVDADAKPEVLVDLTQNFTCYGAPAVFSCGSLGCPYFLYAQRGDAWVELGAVNADDAPGLEVVGGTAGTPATLRGGCVGERPCSELTYYNWKGNAYDRSWIDYRGHIVDIVPNTLATLARDTPVVTAPSKDGQEIDKYPAGTAVVVIGTARAAPYKYVSPCNACRRGFVNAEALTK